MAERARIVVLISGTGRNLQAIIDAIARGEIAGRIEAVICNRPAAAGLQRAQRAGIATQVLQQRLFSNRVAFDKALAATIAGYSPDIVVLAGFMHILGRELVDSLRGRMLNIHPSLLPRHRGLHTHARAIAAGDPDHGASVHFVTAELDGGPVIIQGRIALTAADDPASLASRVLHEIELEIYPLAVAWLAAGRLRLQGDKVVMDDRVLAKPLQLEQLR